MPHQLYHSAETDPNPLQNVVGDLWQSEVVPRLPQDLDAQAKVFKAFVRVRQVKCASDLLRVVLAYVLCGSAASFRRLGAWAVLLGLADLSEAAWRKRLRQASAWLLWLLGELLAVAAQPATGWAQRARGRVLLVDATRIQEEGSDGQEWRVHTAYNLLAGRFAEVTVTDRHGGSRCCIIICSPGISWWRTMAMAIGGVWPLPRASKPRWCCVSRRTPFRCKTARVNPSTC